MITYLYSAVSLKGSNALYNESQGGETGYQPVNNKYLSFFLEGEMGDVENCIKKN